MNKKAYIQPATDTMGFVNHLMEIPASLPKGNSGDPEIEDEDEELSKERQADGWGDLW